MRSDLGHKRASTCLHISTDLIKHRTMNYAMNQLFTDINALCIDTCTHTHRGNVLHVFTCVLHVFTCVDYHWKNEKTEEKRERTKRVRRNFFLGGGT